MYNDVTTCDIVARSKKGEIIGIQTDHRSAKEINQDKEYNTVIAIMRTLAAAHTNPQKIVFAFQEEPPKWYLELIAATGEKLNTPTFYEVGDGPRKPTPKPSKKIDVIKTTTKTMKEIAKKEGATGNPEHDRKIIKKLFQKAKKTGKIEIALIGTTAVAANTRQKGEWRIYHNTLAWYKKTKDGKETYTFFQNKAKKVLDEEDTIEDFFTLTETT